MRVMFDIIQQDKSVQLLQGKFKQLRNDVAISFKGLGQDWSLTWVDIVKATYSGINYVLDVFYNLNEAIPKILGGIPKFFLSLGIEAANSLIQGFENAWNFIMQRGRISVEGIRKQFPNFAALLPAFSDLNLEKFKNTYVNTWKEMGDEVNTIMSRQNDILRGTLDQIETIRTKANQAGMKRIYDDPSRAKDIYKPPAADRARTEAAQEAFMTEKQVKALQKKFEAQKAINDEISKTYEEIDALGETGARFERLTKQFERDAEVEKYAKALRKAGVDTEFITRKTRELGTALERRDLLMKQREAIIELRDTLVEGFDALGSSIVDGLLEGRNALESFKMVLKDFVGDVIKTWLQLAVLNPIKNYLFGTDERTLPEGGFFGNIAKGLPGLFGGGGGGGSAGDPWARTRGANDNWGGVGARLNTDMPPIGMGRRGTRLGSILGKVGIEDYAASIRKVESGSYAGNYNAIGPVTRSGDRAYGAYQVMGNNIPSWTQQALGSRMTPQSFLGNKSAQDAVFQKMFGQSLSKYGNPQDAASVWFSGRPMSKAGNASDTFNTVPQYVKKFNDALSKVTTQTSDVAKTFTDLNQVTPTAVQGLTTLGKGFNTAGQNITAAAQQITMPQAGAGGAAGGGFMGMLGNFFSSIFGGLFGAPMASGGIINTPTAFNANGKMAVGGEAGPEAVMPLTRDNHGNLAVMATRNARRGEGGNVIVNVFAPDNSKVDTKQSTNDNGETIIDVIIEAAKASVAGDLAKGGTAINKSIEGRYNLRSASGLK
jgi:hypothetical protein